MIKNRLTTRALKLSINNKILLNKMDLEFDGGILHGILGPNGAGKSSLLKTLAGIWKASGNVYWNDESLLEKDRKEISRLISLVPQNPQVTFDFLVEDVVAMGRYSHQKRYWSPSETNIIHDALHTVDAWHLRHRLINQISQGERQRVYIARALATESPILLLDEPTASLDIQHQLQVWLLLQKLVKNGKIVIVTTHDLSTAKRYCQQVVILNEGHCLGQGAFETQITPYLLKTVFGVIENPISGLQQYALS